MALGYGQNHILMPFLYSMSFRRKLLHNLQSLLAYLDQVDAVGNIVKRQ